MKNKALVTRNGKQVLYNEEMFEESVNFCDVGKIKQFRKKLEEILSTRLQVKKTFMLPLDVLYKMEFIYYYIYENSITFQFMCDALTSISTNIFFQLTEKGTIRSHLEFLRFTRFIKKYLNVLVSASQNNYPFVQLHHLKRFTSEFVSRKYTVKQQAEFFHYLEENSFLIFKDKPIVGYDEIQDLFKRFEEHYTGGKK